MTRDLEAHVRFPAILLSCNDSGQVVRVYTQVSRSPTSITWYVAKRWCYFAAGKVTAGLVESKGSISPGLSSLL